MLLRPDVEIVGGPSGPILLLFVAASRPHRPYGALPPWRGKILAERNQRRRSDPDRTVRRCGKESLPFQTGGARRAEWTLCSFAQTLVVIVERTAIILRGFLVTLDLLEERMAEVVELG